MLTEAMSELGRENLPVSDWPALHTSPSRYGHHLSAKKRERAPLRAEDALALAEHRFRWEETDALPALDQQGDRHTLTRKDLERAKLQKLQTVSEALSAAVNEGPEQDQKSVVAFDRAVSLHRILEKKDSGAPGPLLVIMAGLHGNETNTVAALDAFLEKAEPERGAIVGMIGNLSALRAGKRYCSHDLNRAFNSGAVEAPEAHEAEDIVEALEKLKGEHDDVMLIDLHGTSAHAPPYVSALSGFEAWPFAEQIPVPHVTGFEKMFSGTLVEFAVSKGWKAVTCEIGCIHEPTTVENGVHFLNLVAHYMKVSPLSEEKRRRISQALKAHCPTTESYSFSYRHSIKSEDQFTMLAGFVSFQKVQEGQRLARDRRGDVLAPCNGRILMPLYQEQGEDGFFVVN